MTIHRLRHRGLSTLYFAPLFLALIGFVSFAVDLGRIRLGQAQLQAASDFAARAGAWGLTTDSRTAQTSAKDIADLNKCLGKLIVLDKNADIDFGIWRESTRTFTVVTE